MWWKRLVLCHIIESLTPIYRKDRCIAKRNKKSINQSTNQPTNQFNEQTDRQTKKRKKILINLLLFISKGKKQTNKQIKYIIDYYNNLIN